MPDQILPDPFDSDDPIDLFGKWLAAAESSESVNPNAMCLATLNRDGTLASRMVLLKGHGPDGFVFYTNLDSRKSEALDSHPQASLCFYWRSLARQVTVDGRVEPVDEATADAYFATRPRDSQIGAWASRQSRPLADRAELRARFDSYNEKFGDDEVPRPPNWSGYRVIPARIEFWHGRDSRLHDRLEFVRDGERWRGEWLYP